jgi:transcription initiation factor TFIID TATA-box-binding protein
MGIDVNIQNIVITTDLGRKVDLNLIDREIKNAEYKPEQFPGLVYRLDDPKLTFLIFDTGKVICTGAKSIEEAEKGIEILVKSLSDAGITINSKPEINVQNLVASASLGMELNLETLALLLDNTEYEPEQFPGMVYRVREPKCVILIFTSGNVVCTGAKSSSEAVTAINDLYNKLKEYGCLQAPSNGLIRTNLSSPR